MLWNSVAKKKATHKHKAIGMATRQACTIIGQTLYL